MASENNKFLQRALAPELKLYGFKKSGATWRQRSDEAISVLNLQGSQWAPSFYINLGVYFRGLGNREQPAEYECHIRARLDALVSDRARLNSLLDFDVRYEDPVRALELTSIVVQSAVPWLRRVSSVSGARAFCASQTPESAWVTPDVRAYLEAAHGA